MLFRHRARRTSPVTRQTKPAPALSPSFRPRLEALEDRRVPSAIPTPPIYQNPFMAPNNFSEIHLNSYQTDTASVSGPASAAGQSVQQGFIGPPTGIAGTIAFNSSGQILTIWTGSELTRSGVVAAVKLRLIDPVTLKVLAQQDLPNRPSSRGVSFSGGGYFYLDNQDRVVLVNTDQQIQIYAVQNNQFVLDRTYPLKRAINNQNDILNSVLPDSAGNLWFITNQGDVGYVEPVSGQVHITSIRDVPHANRKETNTKSFATDGQGGVYVVSDYALYRFQVGPSGAPEATWRTAYDRGTRVKPGQNQQGSGTTPTLFDDSAGNQFVAIADNADPFMHVNVYDRQTGKLVAQQAVFTNLPRRGDTENSLIAVNHSILVENNYGNRTVGSTLGPATTEPDIDRVDFDPTTGQSSVAWENADIAVPSIVSQLSTSDGLEYTYAKDAKGWYWAALDFGTGAIVAKSYVPWSDTLGGVLANNFYGGLTIGPDGSAYAGVIGGLVAWRPVGGPDPSTFRVTNSLDNLLPGSLRYAITQANLPGNEGSTVEITPQVTSPIVLTNGELPINASITIRNDSGAPVEIRQDTADARVFHVAGDRALDVAIAGVTGAVTIDGGSVHDNGGGFLVDNPLTTLTLTDVDVVGNAAADGLEGGGNGGGIYSRGAVVLRGSVVGTTDAPNRASQLAGGVWADRGLTLQASSVDGNRAGADGGGVVVGKGDVTLSDVSSISYNEAPDGIGGGLIVLSGSVLVSGGSHVDGNAAKDDGGILAGRGNVTVLGGSTVNDNSSTGDDISAGDGGGGGILLVVGNITISGSQVSNNHTVGMYSGGIVSVLGNVTVTDGTQVNGNSNAGPGGGIAANFGSLVTVSGGSEVNDNTGAAIGGGIVNFSQKTGGVNVSGGSQVNDNVLTNEQSLGQAIAVFLNLITSQTQLSGLGAAVGGAGGADLLGALGQVEGAARQAAPLLGRAANQLPQPPGLVVTGGGIGTLLAPISVTGGSQVDGNLSGERVSGGNGNSVGFGGGLFSILGSTTIDHGTVAGNQAPYLDGGGIFDFRGTVTLDHGTINGNSAAEDGGGLWSGVSLLCYSSTVADNTAGVAGGGLFNAPRGHAMVLGSEFRGNQAALGGGLANLGTLAVVHGTVAENQAALDGGGIFSGQRLLLLDVLFADNSPNDVARF
jgi:hypothetical protein